MLPETTVCRRDAEDLPPACAKPPEFPQQEMTGARLA